MDDMSESRDAVFEEKSGAVLQGSLGLGVIAGLLDQLIKGFKSRAAYDSSFTTKLSVELFVGFSAQVVAEVSKRGSNSLAEIDFIIADIIMCLTANFAAVYLSAPFGGAPTTSTEKLSLLQEFFAGCPDNAFQRGAGYNFFQRLAAIIKAAPKLFLIGFAAMAVGSGLTSSLGAIRSIMTGVHSGEAASFDSLLNLFQISAATGVYLAVSTNLRYQFVAGILEERLIDPLFKTQFPNKLLQGLCSGFVRTCNTYVGSAMMIDYLKYLGLQGH